MGLKIQEGVLLAPLTTIQIGGAAQYFAEIQSEMELEEALRWASERRLALSILGGGSNLLVADQGVQGVTLLNRIQGMRSLGSNESGQVILEVGAGVIWDEFVAWTVRQDLQGLETLSGIPGSVGATPIQNVGAYGCEIAETVLEVRALDTITGAWRIFQKSELELAYRQSRFKREPGRYLIASVRFALTKGGAPALRYRDLKEAFARKGLSHPSLVETRECVIEIRKSKGMFLDPLDPDSRSCGSFFTNPHLTTQAYQQLVERLKSTHQGVGEAPVPPSFQEGLDRIKVPAAWLIQHSGIRPGFRMGRAAVSSKHVLALTNPGGATAQEILALAQRIQEVVLNKTGIALSLEPELLGFNRKS